MSLMLFNVSLCNYFIFFFTLDDVGWCGLRSSRVATVSDRCWFHGRPIGLILGGLRRESVIGSMVVTRVALWY